MYVAKDLEYWITGEPHYWAERVTINGKAFVRLSPAVITWFKDKIAKAEAACAKGNISLAAHGQIIRAFCPVYDFAVRTGLIPDPTVRIHKPNQETTT